MREDVKKVLFIGFKGDKENFFQRAQLEGLIHFIDPHLTSRQAIPDDVQHLTAAIRILRGLPVTEQEENFNGLDPDHIINTILSLHEQSEKLLEELRVLSLEKSRIEVFGNFSLEDIAYIEEKGHCAIQFFCARSNLFTEGEEPENLIFVASDHALNFYIAINDSPVAYEKMIEMKFDKSLSQLEERSIAVQQSHHKMEHELKGLAKYNEFLHQSLVEKLNRYHLYSVQTYVQQALGGSLFAIEGWVPGNKINRLSNIFDDLNIHFEEIAIELTDVVPTYLENEGLSRLGEDLVHIYDTPSAKDKDPSIWVLFAFTLFFAFIIADAGYGMIYLALAIFLRYRYPTLRGAYKRALNLFTFLCVGCIVWGTLMTSFFGMQIALDNPLRKLSLVQWLAEKKAEYHVKNNDQTYAEWMTKYPELAQAKDAHEFISFVPSKGHDKGYVVLNRLSDNIMFELALFIGVLHLILSLLRYVGRHWQNIGWVAFLIGAYLYFPFYLNTPSFLNFVGGIDLVRGGEIGFELMLGGIGVAWLLSIIRYGWTGIFEIAVLIQVFADTLSYLRLYALGLAGAIVASTINEVAGGLPLIVAVILTLLSHFINIILSTMSGVIHGLRLNFLEWYHYSFEGGGKRFQPLKLLKKE